MTNTFSNTSTPEQQYHRNLRVKGFFFECVCCSLFLINPGSFKQKSTSLFGCLHSGPGSHVEMEVRISL